MLENRSSFKGTRALDMAEKAEFIKQLLSWVLSLEAPAILKKNIDVKDFLF